ncbi:hypothetical protein OTU49_012408, partial [Cherax quadricarinatus]
STSFGLEYQLLTGLSTSHQSTSARLEYHLLARVPTSNQTPHGIVSIQRLGTVLFPGIDLNCKKKLPCRSMTLTDLALPKERDEKKKLTRVPVFDKTKTFWPEYHTSF